MTKSLDSSERLSAPDAKVLNDIKRVGWHTLGVFPNQGDDIRGCSGDRREGDQ